MWVEGEQDASSIFKRSIKPLKPAKVKGVAVVLFAETAAPVPCRGEAAVDARAGVVEVVRTRPVEAVPEEVDEHELSARVHRAEGGAD